MSEPRYAHLVARLLRAARARIGPHPSTPPVDAVAELAGVIRSSAGRRRRRRIVRSIGAAAAIVGIALVVASTWISRQRLTKSGAAASMAVATAAPRPTYVAEGSAVATVMAVGGPIRSLLSGQEWHPGERLRTDGRAVALATRDDSTLDVAPHSDLQLVRADAERWLRLGTGAVEVHVAKLKPAERFVIATPDAEVEVRGTRFRVAIVPGDEACGQGSVTRVSVTEGVVVVRSLAGQSRVEAGRRWPADCPPNERSVSVAPGPAPARLRGEGKRAAVPHAAAVRDPAAVDVPGSTLATENDLFGAALKAEAAGDRREAVHLLEVLLARFPQSPLKESALVERARLIGATQSRP